jgi:hypothetical protein
MYNQSITIKTSVSEEEYCAFKSGSMLSRTVLMAVCAPLVILGVLGKVTRIIALPMPVWIGSYVIGVVGAFFWQHVTYTKYWRELYAKGSLGTNVDYTFQPEGLSYAVDGKTTRIPWAKLYAYKETKRFLMVYYTERECIVFPKDCMRNDDAIDAIRQYISALPKHKRNILNYLSLTEKIRFSIFFGLLILIAGALLVQLFR